MHITFMMRFILFILLLPDEGLDVDLRFIGGGSHSLCPFPFTRVSFPLFSRLEVATYIQLRDLKERC